MFSRALRSSALNKTAQQTAVRFQTTAVPKSGSKKASEKAQDAPKRRATDDLYEIVRGEYKELTPLYDRFAGKLKRDIDGGYVNSRQMIAIGNILLSKVANIKKEQGITVPDHVLFERVIKTLISNKVLHGSHLIKYLRALIEDKKYAQALELYVENLQGFKEHPECLVSMKNGKEVSLDRDFKCLAVIAYVMSLKEASGSIDQAFFKSLLQGSQFSLFYLKRYMDFIGLSRSEKIYIANAISDFQDKCFDINSATHLQEVAKLSRANLLLKLEVLCDKSLAKFAGRESAVAPETLLSYMKAFNQCNHSAKVMELWAWGQQHGVIGAKPKIEFWNQLLLAQLKSNVKDKEAVVESIWDLIQREATPNAETYSVYLKCLTKLQKFPQVMSMVNKIKTQQPELWNSELKCDTVRALVLSRKFDEGLTLFRTYSKEEDFKANAETYNILFNGLLKSNKFDEASELLDTMTHDAGFEPDIATWTSIMNYLMKLGSRSELSTNEMMDYLLKIMTTMKESGVAFNKVAIFMVLNNLLKNKDTFELGLNLLMQFENTTMKLNDIGYTGIITGMASNGAMDSAIEYYYKAIKAGVSPKASMYNSIFKGFYHHPDITATKKFYTDEVLKLAASGKPNLQPNQFTFYFMISQAIRKNDPEFVQFVINEMAKFPDFILGQSLPNILKKCQEDCFIIPDSLLKRIQ